MTHPNVLLMTSMSAPGFHLSPPVGLYRLKHHLEKNGVPCDLLDADLVDENQYLQAVGQGQYDIIGFSVSHFNMKEDLDRLWRFRSATEKLDADILFIAGGQEAAMNYGQWLSCGIDLVVLGFAERTLLSLCRQYAKHRGEPLSVITEGLQGIGYRDTDRQPVFVPAPPLEKGEFRELSYTQLMEMELPYTEYWNKVKGQVDHLQFNHSQFVAENVRLFTSSHCPRRCGFCSSQSFLPKSHGRRMGVRSLSAEEIFDLVVRHVRKYGARGFLFSDDDFLIGTDAGIERAQRFCQLVIDAKACGRLPSDIIFNCQSRVADLLVKTGNGKKVIHLDLLSQLSRAGFHSLGLGVETFSDRLMQQPSIHKTGVTVTDCRNVLDGLLGFGLCPQINILLGVPESTVDELLETLGVTLDYLERGCQVAITAYIRCMPGAPIFGSRDYRTVYQTWTHPETGETVKIADRFEPNDPVIADAMASLDAAEKQELDAVKSASGWGGRAIPKSVFGMTKIAALAQLLGASSLYRRSHSLTINLLSKTSTASDNCETGVKDATCVN